MDMAMDVAWCLTCSKQMSDPRSPYCSEACRLQDTEPLHSSSHPIPLTSPVPPGLMLSPPPRHTPLEGQHSAFASIPSGRRPSINPFGPPNGSSSSKTAQRDRRAFSFPASQAVAPITQLGIASRRQTNATLQFARKSNGMASGATASPIFPGSAKSAASRGNLRLSKTTGLNTPMIPDSVFCSTSEGSDCGGGDPHEGSPVKSSRPISSLPALGRFPNAASRSAMPKPFTAVSPQPQVSTSSPFITARPHLISRKSPSPVAAMIASSASSKSREDIVSWLNDVERLPSEGNIDRTIRPRGRSRTRREVLAGLSPSDLESNDNHDAEGALSTTPKGRIGSAIAGLSSLSSFGVGPIVKALTGAAVTSHNVNTSSSHVEGLGLQSIPAPAEVSRIAVTTFPGELDGTHMLQMGGATPTLSTVSFSEIVDPLTDNGDHFDFYTDDQSLADSSAFARHVSLSSGKAAATLTNAANNDKEIKAATNQSNSVLRSPITNTASAFWNLSTYLRSFAPFSISSAIAPYAPIAAAGDDRRKSTPTKQASSSGPSPTPAPVAAPVPTTRPIRSEPESPAQQMVRSLPMDIVLPLGAGDALAERLRHREIQEWLDSPSGSPRSRSRGRDRTRAKVNSRSASHDREREDRQATGSNSRHGRKISYDADASGEDEPVPAEERRGRSRREKVLRDNSSEERRGRGRDRAVRA